MPGTPPPPQQLHSTCERGLLPEHPFADSPVYSWGPGQQAKTNASSASLPPSKPTQPGHAQTAHGGLWSFQLPAKPGAWLADGVASPPRNIRPTPSLPILSTIPR